MIYEKIIFLLTFTSSVLLSRLPQGLFFRQKSDLHIFRSSGYLRGSRRGFVFAKKVTFIFLEAHNTSAAPAGLFFVATKNTFRCLEAQNTSAAPTVFSPTKLLSYFQKLIIPPRLPQFLFCAFVFLVVLICVFCSPTNKKQLISA